MAADKKRDEEVGYNYTAKDKIWKDHCIQEMKQASVWEHNWSFLKKPYKEVIEDDSEKIVEKRRPNVKRTTIKLENDKSKHIAVKSSPSRFPKTTSGEVGWRSGHKELQLELFGPSRFAKGSILKQLNWPTEAIG